MVALTMAERGLVPDWLVRHGIRHLLRRRLEQERPKLRTEAGRGLEAFAEELRAAPIVIEAESANEQHYEVPPAFYKQVLGPRLKYSCGYWPGVSSNLAESEEAMLDLTCRRAELEDGMNVLDLGCGWGSLSLWIAEKYPQCRITAVSNSNSQRETIESRCRLLGLDNVEVRTCNVAELELERQFDRVLSIEMFEHVRNYQRLLCKIASWLRDNGKLFVHIFCHRELAYPFENKGSSDWMSRHFFTGGIMPAEKLFTHFEDDLQVERQWRVPGWHYARTCEAWLQNLDQNRGDILEILDDSSATESSRMQVQRWRMFFMACAELFRYGGGDEWFVGHYLFHRPE